MKRSAGFTLLEVVVALTVTGVVALLAYGALQAGIDTSERADRAQAAVSVEAVTRAVLLDALRHLPEGGGAAMNEPLFTLENRESASGLPADALAFLSQGIGAAPGTGGFWSVTLAPTDRGVALRAVPIDARDGAPFELIVGAALGLDAEVLARTAESAWLDGWDVLGRVPAAVRIQLFDAAGRPLGSPLIAHAALEVVP